MGEKIDTSNPPKNLSSSNNGLDQPMFTPKASRRKHKRPRVQLGAPRPSIKKTNSESPNLSSNGTSTHISTSARSMLFDTSSRKGNTSKDSVGDSIMSMTAKMNGNNSKTNADDPKSPPPRGKRSSLFGAVMQNVQSTPAKSSSAVNFLDNFSPYAKTPTTPFSPASSSDQWQEAPLDGEWFDFGLYATVELEGQPRMDLMYDDATALSASNHDTPSLSEAQVFHRFPPSMVVTSNTRVSEITWKSAFRSLYFKWKAHSGNSCFYMVSGTHTALFRKRIQEERIIPEITFSKCRFSDVLRQRYGVQLYLATKWNKHAQGTEWDDSLQKSRKSLAISPGTKAELQALHNAPTIGADISIHTDLPRSGSSTLPSLYVSGQDDCDAIYEYYMNTAPVEAHLITRAGAFLHSSLERLSPSRRQTLEGPILPSAVETLCRAAAHVGRNSDSAESYWLVTATSSESTLMIAWERERPDIVAYKKR